MRVGYACAAAPGGGRATLENQGPGAVVEAVREAELADPVGRFPGKRHDDATVAFGRPGLSG
ncbi:hypothetical protein [Kitasatospora azatica]|uniref:hypothetical protein n=1 Tax=Kitasatospora azatica TaxID=58347 RepID=UPI00056B008B|nr:hypothetical protein [Kitasatospora azatica]